MAHRPHGAPATVDVPTEAGLPAAPSFTRRTALAVGAAGLVVVPVLDWLSPASALAAVPTISAKDFGATGNGTTNDTAAVQKLIDASARQGAIGVLPTGTYRCTGSLLLPAGTQLRLDSGARLLKDWAAEPGLANAFLRNASFAGKSNGVRITGPGSIGARNHTRTGVILALYGDDVLLQDLTIDTYAGGQAVMYAGNRGRMDRVRIRNSAATAGTGGIRVFGGEDFLATACDVQSGDDALQFVPIGDPRAALFDQSITRGRFTDCTGVSTVSRFMVALLEWTSGEGGMTASVTNCSFSNCRGSGTDRGIVVKNTHSTGMIQGLAFTDCSVDMSRAANAGTQEVRIHTEPASPGWIRDVTFTRTNITRPVNSVLRIDGPRITGITFDTCTFPAPSGTATTVVAVVDQADQVRMVGCSFAGTRGRRLLVVGPTSSATALSVESCRFTDIGNDRWGVDLVAVRTARVARSTFTRAAGATTARAVRVGTACSGVVVEENDFTGLGNSTKVTNTAPDTVVRSNVG